MRLHKEGIVPITVALTLFALCLFLYFHFLHLPTIVDVLVVLALAVGKDISLAILLVFSIYLIENLILYILPSANRSR